METALAGAAPASRAKSMEEAVSLAADHACPGDVVLLAPACASFDMFENYKQRGQVFIKAVMKHFDKQEELAA